MHQCDTRVPRESFDRGKVLFAYSRMEIKMSSMNESQEDYEYLNEGGGDKDVIQYC